MFFAPIHNEAFFFTLKGNKNGMASLFFTVHPENGGRHVGYRAEDELDWDGGDGA